jgi:DNA-binding PadR family transcriptional regulator
MIAFGQRTGYDIKQLVDKTTRHFWAASYGQIYPELRRLEAEGLVRGRPEPSGGRARTVLEMTDAGEAALREWLCDSDEPTYELRDEGMLKLFFSDVVGPELGLEHVRAIRLRHTRKLEQLRALEEHVAETGRSGLCLTLQLGINLQESTIAWCESTERQLADEAGEPGGG